MKIEIFDGNWTTEDVELNINKLFVFGDNNFRVGKGGQAIIRDLSNSIGIRTKKGPSNKTAAFYNDSEYIQNIKNIREDILNIKSEILLGKYDTVVFSKNGYGTGLAQLERLAPKTFSELCYLLLGHFNFENKTGNVKKRIPGYDEIMSGKYVSLDNKKFESNVLTPINNSFFKKDYLEHGINTLYNLVKYGKKIAFTYPVNHNIGDIVIFSVINSKKYLVCRIIDSYVYKEVSIENWSLFEGYESNYLENLKLSNSEQILYQNHFEFICTLDEEGRMEYNKDIFGDQLIKNNEQPKFIGQTLTSTVIIPDGLKKLLKKKKIEGDIEKISESIDYKFYKKEKYQVKSGDTYYAVEYNIYPLWDSINILLTSKSSFI
jgi:hypothetical protein